VTPAAADPDPSQETVDQLGCLSALSGDEDLAELIGKLSRRVTEPGDVRAGSEQGP